MNFRKKMQCVSFFVLLINSCAHVEKKEVQAKSPQEEFVNNAQQWEYFKSKSKSLEHSDLTQVYRMTQEYLKAYPSSAHAQYKEAVMAGDYSELLSAEEEIKIKKNAAKTLFSLLENPDRYPPSIVYILRNEYYYHSGKYLDQYLLGCESIKAGNLDKGTFSQGVGASEVAFELWKKKEYSEAKRFAQIASRAWEKNSELSPNWKHPYPYFYIQALEIAGERDKAQAFYAEIKKGKEYQLKIPIYQKYDQRIKIIHAGANE